MNMNREEAIAYGKSVIKAGLYAESQAFWKIAVKSLEQESCDDAISRQAVEDAVYDASRAMDLNYEQIVGYIDKIPPAGSQPKMRKCKWIKYDHRTICPKEHDADNPYWRIPEDRKDALKYCPYCGLEITIEE